MVITNAYIIKKSPELRCKAEAAGLHSLIDFDGPIMTDSGTFQMHVYGKVDTTSEEIVAFQKSIGSDICTILDIFSETEDTREQAEAGMVETLQRASAASGLAEMELALPIQGGLYLDLRERCARELSRLEAAVYPIGGVVPLMESYRYGELVEVILHSKKGLRHDRPVHLFGCGHPMLFPLAVFLGCDLFDSASYIKYARDGRMLFSWGTRHISGMEELPCDCLVCRDNTVEDVLSMEDGERTRVLALHNLSVSFGELKRVKQALREGRLWEMVCHRARVHPSLLEAMASVKKHAPWIERYTPSTRPKGMLYTGLETLWRPEVYHVLDRLFSTELFPRDSYVLVPFMGGKSMDWSREHIDDLLRVWADRGVLVDSIFGPVPLELSEAYPFGGMILPSFPREWEASFYPTVGERRKKLVSRMEEWGKDVDELDIEGMGEAEDVSDEELRASFNAARMHCLCSYQFFPGAGDILLDGPMSLVVSKNTGKIRNVISGGEHILSLRAEDGMFSLKVPGARRLCQCEKGAKVVVDKDTGAFNREGKNVMARFVLSVTEEINPGDEVYVVDEDNALLAVGRALLNAQEMKDFTRGVAVKVREGVVSVCSEEEE